MWLLGIDAGGTKTHCLISDENGRVIGEGFGGAANYQTVGVTVTKQSLMQAIDNALKQGNLTLDQIGRAVFGMSGADEAVDFQVLEPLAKEIMGQTPVTVLNDTWIGLRSGAQDGYGIGSICGTGAGHAGRNKQGKMISLRNLDYILGNRGGGGELMDSAIHFAFRSNEGTYKKTCLEEALLRVFHADNMDQVCELIRLDEFSDAQKYQIPIEVIKAAREGDQVAIEIVTEMGRTEGQYAGGLLKRLEMTEEAVPIVLIGSLFKLDEPLIIKPYMEEVRKVAPKAYYVIPDKAPVYGAIGLCMDQLRMV